MLFFLLILWMYINVIFGELYWCCVWPSAAVQWSHGSWWHDDRPWTQRLSAPAARFHQDLVLRMYPPPSGPLLSSERWECILCVFGLLEIVCNSVFRFDFDMHAQDNFRFLRTKNRIKIHFNVLCHYALWSSVLWIVHCEYFIEIDISIWIDKKWLKYR